MSDLIDREIAIKALDAKSEEFPEFGEAIYILEELPSVTPTECKMCTKACSPGVCTECKESEE